MKYEIFIKSIFIFITEPLPNIYSVAEYIAVAESIAESLFIAESFEKCFARNNLPKNRHFFNKMFRAKHFV